MLDAIKSATGMDEVQLLEHLATKAITDNDLNLYKEVLTRCLPPHRLTQEPITFSIPTNATPTEQCQAVLDGIANGDIPPDVGATIIQAINTSVEVTQKTELQDRLERIEAMLNKNNNN